MENRKKGITFILLSSLFFALMAATVKFLGDMPTAEKIFFRNLVGIFVAFSLVKKSGSSLIGNNKKLLILRSTFGLLGIAAYFYALANMKLSDAVILNKMSPFFVMIFAALFLKEKITKKQLIALVTAALGAILVIRPGFDSNLIPSLIALMSSIFAGVAYTLVRQLRKTDSAATVVFYFSFFSTIAMIPFMLSGSFVIPTAVQALALLALGLFAAVAQLFMTNAYRHAEASELSIYTYANIVFSSVFGFVLFQEIPDIFSIIGAFLIISAGYLNYRAKEKEQAEKAAKLKLEQKKQRSTV
ncbi:MULTISPECIES: DMT family transporter [Halanaerobium]|uniref:EamA domain-containing membrane protein RarD n=1 Tax=Halanaerobium kushneri TaxID=56779 RepID=A0A1N7ACJ9_9FIRM|nr:MULTISPECIES: DMT family transporter [Halanaerobium]RCW54645.1 EamA domain-containing membrane protein RarD [Halanaerobium sp. ST460_2HS_T2]SIR36701.1 EamA domain-containing membrane protein RarD [Halanaerobium kushneri]